MALKFVVLPINMSQQDGEKGESRKRSRKSAVIKSAESDENSSEAVTKLIVKKVEESTNPDTGATIIRPEPRRLQKAPLVEVDQEDVEEESELSETEPVARLEASRAKHHSESKPHEITLAKFEKRETLPSEDIKQEEQWEENKSIGWWVAIGGICLVLILVGAVLLSNHWDALGMKQVEAPQIVLPTTENPFAGSPEEWFRNRAGIIFSQATVVLEGYAAARNDQERSRWVRNPEVFLKRAPAWAGGIEPRPGDHNEETYEVDHIEDTGYLVLKTEDRNFMPMRVYFVRQGEELKIDWVASTAWSEMSFDMIAKEQASYEKKVTAARKEASEKSAAINEAYRQKMELYQKAMDEFKKNHRGPKHTVVAGDSLESIAARYGRTVDEIVQYNGFNRESFEVGQVINLPAKPGAGVQAPAIPQKPSSPQAFQEPELPTKSFQKSVIVRCYIERQNEFYAGPYNDTDHSAFMISSPDMRQSFWAYVKRDSQLDLKLKGLLDHGSFVVPLKKDVLVTLRVRSGKKDALPSQLEVVELVHAEWLTP